MMRAVLILALAAFTHLSCASRGQGVGTAAAKGQERLPDAECAAADRQSVEVTVYNKDFGLVKDTRKVALQAGSGTLRFADVPSKIIPKSVLITPRGDGAESFSVREQNYDYDLMSHEKLLDKYVGRDIQLLGWNEYKDREEVIEAKLLSSKLAGDDMYGDYIDLDAMSAGELEHLYEDIVFALAKSAGGRKLRSSEFMNPYFRSSSEYLQMLMDDYINIHPDWREAKMQRIRDRIDRMQDFGMDWNDKPSAAFNRATDIDREIEKLRKELELAEAFPGSKGNGASGGEVFKIGNEIYLGHPGIKVLPEIPGNLISRPTLSWGYVSDEAREYELEVSYMTQGLKWEADYILTVNFGDTLASLNGWVTIDNKSGASYENAILKLLAGDVAKLPEPKTGRDFDFEDAEVIGYLDNPTPVYIIDMDDPNSDIYDVGPSFVQSEMFEYHIYDLQRPTTLKDKQTKQIDLLTAGEVRVKKEYFKRSNVENNSWISNYTDHQPIDVYYTFENTEDNGLGVPLPAGKIRLYTTDSAGRLDMIGEDKIEHTATEEELRLKAGDDIDITVKRELISVIKSNKRNRPVSVEWKVVVRNRKSEDVTVTLEEYSYSGWTSVETSSHEYKKKDAFTLEFEVFVEKGGEAEVVYRLVF